VPADPSSSIPAALAQLAHADPLRPAEPPQLLAIGALARAGPVNLAAALRQHARDPARPLATLGIILG
jgi:hypothetical protein